ncbi:contact-dependent growth inhibition system immunity protein [Amycolatopsis sp. NPDC054798]
MANDQAENQYRTLEEIEGESWGDAPEDESYLVRTVHRLRRKPLGQLTVEDLRILLGQNVGTEHILPLGLRKLEKDPLAEGDYYPGDLLVAAMKLPVESWAKHPDWENRMGRVVSQVEATDPATNPDVDDQLLGKIKEYRDARTCR